MRYSASEKFEIIELVEQSSLSIRRTLAPIGIPGSTFYDWYSRYQEGGIEALVDGKPRPRRIWNKIPDKIERRSSIWPLRSRTCRRVSSSSTSRKNHRAKTPPASAGNRSLNLQTR